MTLTRQQSHTDRGATHLGFKYSSLRKKNEKQTKKERKKNNVEGQRQYEMLTVFCYIASDSPESAAKTVVLMKNMSDGFQGKSCMSNVSSRLH